MIHATTNAISSLWPNSLIFFRPTSTKLQGWKLN